MNMPIDEFRKEEDLTACCAYWQRMLFLDDWIIKATVNAPEDFINKEVCGENIFDVINKCSRIRILEKKYYGDRIMYYYAEKILVHELLHCKYNVLSSGDNYESVMLDIHEHALLEEMAKTLIMTKYNLDLGYFKKKIK